MKKFSEYTRYKIILFFAMLYVITDCACNTVLYKIVTMGDLVLPAGIFIYPVTFIIADIVAEVYGYKIARLIVFYDLFFNFLFAIFVTLLIHLPSPSYWHLEQSYIQVLGGLLRANIAVILAVLVGSIANIYFITRWKRLTQGRYFWLRSISSTIIGESIMLIISVFIAYSGKLSLSEMLKLIPSDYLFRILYAIIGAFPATIITRYLKLCGENEIGILKNTFNPFADHSTNVNLQIEK